MANAQAAAMKKKRKLFSIANGFDMPFLIILMLILVIGLVCMYSASYAYAFYWYDGDSYYFIKRQLAFAVLGVVAMLMISTIDYHVLHKFSWVLWIVPLGKVLCLLFHVGTAVHAGHLHFGHEIGQLFQLLRDLLGQLPGGGHDHGLRVLVFR